MIKRKTKRRRKKLDLLRASRDLSALEFQIIEFIWCWKTVPASLVKEIFLKNKSEWQSYKVIRRLRRDGILDEIPKGKVIRHRLLCLTELGFDIFLSERDFTGQQRFRVHSPAHDYLSTALQLGGVYKVKDPGLVLFSEQEIQTLPARLLPKKIYHNKDHSAGSYSVGHIPDGISVLKEKSTEIIIGYEVEINLKPANRYHAMRYYYGRSFDLYSKASSEEIKVDHVIILAKNLHIAQRIHFELTKLDPSVSHDRQIEKLSFVLVDDFIKQGWDASIIMGDCKDLSLKKLHSIYWQQLGKTTAISRQESDWSVFFPTRQSPKKSTPLATKSLFPGNQTECPSVRRIDGKNNPEVIP